MGGEGEDVSPEARAPGCWKPLVFLATIIVAAFVLVFGASWLVPGASPYMLALTNWGIPSAILLAATISGKRSKAYVLFALLGAVGMFMAFAVMAATKSDEKLPPGME